MEDWLRTAAQSLGVDAIDDDMQERLLGVARDVAHGVERKITPLATFLLGEAVQRRDRRVADTVGARRSREPRGLR